MGGMAEERPRIGISACLLGAPVRYDGGHKRDGVLVETVGRYVEWVPVCPEEEAGFGTPREPMRLQASDPRRGDRRGGRESVSLVVIRTGEDVTARLYELAERRAGELARAGLSGFILKKDSPSCGIEGVPVHDPGGAAQRVGRGLFADALIRRIPQLPVEDEGRLADPRLRQDFIERVLAYHRAHFPQQTS
jgi:uncharacterized protein YbbK (DUF523 family)